MGIGNAGGSAEEPAPKFTSASIHTPNAGGNSGQLTLASVGFFFRQILMRGTLKIIGKLIN